LRNIRSTYSKKKNLNLIYFFLIFFLTGCVVPFELPEIASEAQVFVDASFTNEEKIHTIRLFNSAPLGVEETTPATEANVWIESESGEIIRFTESSPGNYTSAAIGGREGVKYTLFIDLSDGRRIVSEPVEMPKNQVLDQVYGRVVSLPSETSGDFVDGVQFFVDTQPSDEGKIFLRYEVVESYKFSVSRASMYELLTEPVFIPSLNLVAPLEERDSSVSFCYRTELISELLVTSSTGQTSNEIREFPVRFIAKDDKQLGFEYIIQVRQLSITNDAHKYFQDLKSQNESAGSLFDSQNGNILGNLIFADSEEPVLGYFEVASASEITDTYFPVDFNTDDFKLGIGFGLQCINELQIPLSELGGFFYGPASASDLYNPRNIIDFRVVTVNAFQNIVFIADSFCSDCTATGGTLVSPLLD